MDGSPLLGHIFPGSTPARKVRLAHLDTRKSRLTFGPLSVAQILEKVVRLRITTSKQQRDQDVCRSLQDR